MVKWRGQKGSEHWWKNHNAQNNSIPKKKHGKEKLVSSTWQIGNPTINE
jgi:hypothetical protein